MNNLSWQRPAFTARELIVVICVVVMIVVLWPMVLDRDMRIPARYNTCRNNMMNLAFALLNYEVRHKEFPGYCEDVDRTPAASPNDNRSWLFVLLPLLESRSLYDQYIRNETPNKDIDVALEFCVCPSLPPSRTVGVRARNAYVANCGLLDGLPAAGHPRDFAANGVFHSHSASASADSPYVTVSAAYISEADGLSTTLLLSENADAARWTGGPSVRGSVPSERWLGFTWHDADGLPGDASQAAPSEPLAINVRTGESYAAMPQALAPGYTRPSSYHPGGVNVAFCDGHVRFVNDKISYRIYQALMTPRGQDAMHVSRDAQSPPQPLPADHAARKKPTEAEVWNLLP